MKSKKKGKYAEEIERLKELNAIKEVLKKSDIENAALTNTSKDSETVSDNAVDNMLEQLNLDKNARRDLEIIESLTAQRNGLQTVKRKSTKISGARKRMKIKHKVHMIKRAKPHKVKRKKR